MNSSPQFEASKLVTNALGDIRQQFLDRADLVSDRWRERARERIANRSPSTTEAELFAYFLEFYGDLLLRIAEKSLRVATEILKQADAKADPVELASTEIKTMLCEHLDGHGRKPHDFYGREFRLSVIYVCDGKRNEDETDLATNEEQPQWILITSWRAPRWLKYLAASDANRLPAKADAWERLSEKDTDATLSRVALDFWDVTMSKFDTVASQVRIALAQATAVPRTKDEHAESSASAQNFVPAVGPFDRFAGELWRKAIDTSSNNRVNKKALQEIAKALDSSPHKPPRKFLAASWSQKLAEWNSQHPQSAIKSWLELSRSSKYKRGMTIRLSTAGTKYLSTQTSRQKN